MHTHVATKEYLWHKSYPKQIVL